MSQKRTSSPLVKKSVDSNHQESGILKSREIPKFGEERRRAPRYQLKFEILLITPNSSLRSRTVNVSLSGALMDKPAPKAFLNGPVDIVIIIPHRKSEQKTYLNFRGLMVGGAESSSRLTFLQDKDNSFEKLKNMLSEIEKLAA